MGVVGISSTIIFRVCNIRTSFTVSSATGTASFTVTFTDTSSAVSSVISAWQWDFGDGATSTDRNPVYECIGAGNYSVSLTVSTSVGSDTEARSGAVLVEASPTFVSPTVVATFFDADEGDIFAAENQVLLLLDEGISQIGFDSLVTKAKALGADYQALDRDLHIAQFYAENGQEILIRDQLANEAGVIAAFLNRVETPGQLSSEHQYQTQTFVGNSVVNEKVPAELGVSPTGTFWWLDDVDAAGAWQLLADDPELSRTKLSVIDTGLPKPQALLDETRIDRIGNRGYH